MNISKFSISKVFDEAQESTFSTELGIKRLKEIINFEEDLFEELNKVCPNFYIAEKINFLRFFCLLFKESSSRKCFARVFGLFRYFDDYEKLAPGSFCHRVLGTISSQP